jgi:tRNA threonylcarbamoyladenosine biosynthesis protein TsaB
LKSPKILAVDTTTPICGVALYLDSKVPVELILNHGQTHARHLMDAIDAVLKLGYTDVCELDAFAVTQGPGSFTGLRIGISTVKGLALAAGKPVIAVSTLETLAHQAPGGTELICAMIDARRRQVYWALYQQGENVPSMPAQCGRAVDVIAHIKAPCCFIGSGSQLYQTEIEPQLKFPSQWVPDHQNHPRPSVVARLAGWKFTKTCYQDPAELEPLYLRRSDAEIKHLPAGDLQGASGKIN